MKIFLLTCLALVLVLVGGAAGWYWYYFHGRPFSPVELSRKEKTVVNEKIELAGGDPVFVGPEVLEPGDKPIVLRDNEVSPSTAEPDRRTIFFSEREINGLLHHNTDLAEKLHIDLERDALVARVIYPFEEEVPVVGGKTLRLKITMKLFIDDQHELQFALDDVSVGGIPLPNAWLFDLKDKNLIDLDSGPEGTGLLKRIADGIEDFRVERGQIRIRLAE